MEDEKIIELYFKKDENAIRETDKKYGSYLFKIAHNITFDNEDSKECVNDTYFRTWNSIPPYIPKIFSSFLGKITRGLAVDILRKKNSEKRRCSEYELSLYELDECIPDNSATENEFEYKLLTESINRFLLSIQKEKRNIFVCRYFYNDSLKEIANYFGYSENKIKSILFRTRKALKEHLIKEGFFP